MKESKNKKIDKIKKFLNSIKVQVLFIMFIVILVPVLICNVLMPKVAHQRYLEQKSEKLLAQNTMLKNCIISENYMDTLESSLVKAETNRISNGYNGRIEIINADYIVVSDTYSTDEGKTCISEMVMRSMTGESISLYNEKEDYLEFAMPIAITENNSGNSDDTINSENESTKIIGAVYTRYSTNDLREFAEILLTYAMGIDAIFLVVAFLVSLFISRYISKPFSSAEKTLEAITAGDTAMQVEISGYTEMRQMGEAINHLLDKLGQQEQSRQEFVSNVSHELKTPITSMKVLADSLIGQQNVPEELYQEFLTDIGKEIDRENAIITDLLSLVRMDKKDAEINISQCNINDIVELTLKRLRPIAAQKNIELVFESFRPVMADVDSVKITIVISNLVENAIKYNVNDGWVRVSLNADHQYFYLKVQDSGIGIGAEEQDKIFERFFRVDKARARETGGTGLGLAITRRIVLMHKGSIKVHSVEGDGTTFTVRIPLKYIVQEDIRKNSGKLQTEMDSILEKDYEAGDRDNDE